MTAEALGLHFEADTALHSSLSSTQVVLAWAALDKEHEVVRHVLAALQAQGIPTVSPWLLGRRGPAHKQESLDEAVRASQLVLLILSPHAPASRDVRTTVHLAHLYGRPLAALWIAGDQQQECLPPHVPSLLSLIDARTGDKETIVQGVLDLVEQGLAALVPVLHMQQDKATPTPLSAQTQPGDLGQQPGQKEPAETGHPAFNNLPAQLTPLIGREQELQAVCALMHQPEVRLVTLLGPGGVGKTRLGLAVAQSMLSGFAEGVCFVPLASIRNAEQVIPTIAKTLDLWEAREQPLLSQLQAALHEKHFLLLLDNFEQIVPAAPALADLLASCPHLALLVTSRSALHLVGEYEFPVPPLLTPDLTQLPESQQLAHNAAVALFVARAQAMQPSFRLTPANANAIAAICVRLDGLPLAIELAAARSKLLPPEALLKRLSRRFEVLTRGAQNLPSRQQTLRNTLQWSYDLLTQEEQRLFRWLSVFVGGCILEAAEAVCQGQGKQGIEVLEGVTSLLDKSLLQRTEQEGEEPRLLSLETIREYGWERLQAAGELAAAEQAHASYYLQVAEEAEPQLKGAEQVAWRKQLEHEQQNLRAAIAWALSSGQPEVALRVSCALWSFWIRQGYPREGSDLLEHVLAGSAAAPAPLRAKALFAAGALALAQLDFRRFWQIVEAYQPLAQELRDQQHMAVARLGQGIIALQRHPEAAVWTRLEESLADLKKQGDLSWITMMLYVLGRLALMQGDAPRALALLEECLARARAAGDTLFQALPLLLLGQMALTQGDLATAQERLEEEVALSQGTGERMTTPYALTLQGLIRWRQGKMDEAQASFKEGVRLYREQGIGLGIARLLLLLGHIAVEEGNMAEARADYAESLTIAREIEVEGFTATGLKGSGVVVAKAGQLALAARLWGATEQLRESQDISIPAAVYEQAVQAVRTQLGEQAFDSAWAEGRTMPLEQVIDDVLMRGDEAGKQ
jgi:predicted ATPase